MSRVSATIALTTTPARAKRATASSGGCVAVAAGAASRHVGNTGCAGLIAGGNDASAKRGHNETVGGLAGASVRGLHGSVLVRGGHTRVRRRGFRPAAVP